MTDQFSELQDRQQAFIAERNWEQFHTPKSLSMAIAIEAGELMELFQWHDNLRTDAYENAPELQAAIEEELADVLIYSLSLATEFDIDLEDAIAEKLTQNEQRFDEEHAATLREELERWKR